MDIRIMTKTEAVDVKMLTGLLTESKEVPVSQADAVKLFDEEPWGVAEIKFKNVFPEFMNMIRRCGIGELSVESMIVKEYYSTDQQIFEDHFKRKITQIPIRQDKSYEDITFSLNQTNTTDSIQRIYSGHLVASNGQPVNKYFSPLMQICILHPGCQIKVNSIEVGSGTPAGKHYAFKMINGNPAYDYSGDSGSMTIKSYPRTPIKYVLERIFLNLSERVGQIQEVLEQMPLESSAEPKISFTGVIQYRPTNAYILEGETSTIAVVFKYYIEDMDRQSQVKVMPTTHPGNRSTTVVVNAKDAHNLLKRAVDQCMKDLKKFGDAVKNVK